VPNPSEEERKKALQELADMGQEFDGAIKIGRNARNHLDAFLRLVDVPDPLKEKWVQIIERDIKTRGEPETYALFGLDVWAHKDELKKHGFRFSHHKQPGRRGYWIHQSVDDKLREFVASIDLELVSEECPDPSASQVAEWHEKLMNLSKETEYVVYRKGREIKMKKAGRTIQVVRRFIDFRKWAWILTRAAASVK